MKEKKGNGNRWKDKEEKGSMNLFFYCGSFVVLAAVFCEDCVETLYYFCAFECSFFTDCPSLQHR